jgi:hypothetical protein
MGITDLHLLQCLLQRFIHANEECSTNHYQNIYINVRNNAISSSAIKKFECILSVARNIDIHSLHFAKYITYWIDPHLFFAEGGKKNKGK